MAGPILFNMKWRRGGSYRLDVTILDNAGVADDITGDTFAFTVRRGPLNLAGEVIEFQGQAEGWEATGEDTTAIISKVTGSGITTTDALTGQIQIEVTAADTLLLDADDYSYDLFRTNAGAEAPLTVGTIRVLPSVRG
jgi:hypothetical protein